MRVADFDYELPEELIAQRPLEHRESSRLLAVGRADGRLSHRTVAALPRLLRRGDLLVLNDTRVVRSRLLGRKAESGGRVELLVIAPDGSAAPHEAFARAVGDVRWTCLGQSSKGLRQGTWVEFGESARALIVQSLGEGQYTVRFEAPDASMALFLARVGHIPLPPYVKRPDEASDDARYQTVYGQHPGSAAAPTAGLHFSERLLAELEQVGVKRAYVTLHVGPGTFSPLRADEVAANALHREWCSVPNETALAIHSAKAAGARVVAVGTTVVRTLESAYDASNGSVKPGSRDTALFIYPGFEFHVVDAMVTNFHLPKSSLLMLVSAFAGVEVIRRAYALAVQEKYRFFSYGDAMYIGDIE